MRKALFKGSLAAFIIALSIGISAPDIYGTDKKGYSGVVYASESKSESEEAEPVTDEIGVGASAEDSAVSESVVISESNDLAASLFTVSGIKSKTKPTQAEIIAMYGKVKANNVTKKFQTAPSAKKPYSTGKLDSTFTNSGITFLNFYRYTAGLGTVTLDSNLMYGTSGAQYGAVLLAANRNVNPSFGLTHTPPCPSDMDSGFYNNGYAATTSSNISMRTGYNTFYSLEQSLYGCMNDNNSTSNITTMGHRRWFLNPSLGKVGFGYAESDSGSSYIVSKVFDRSAYVGDYDFISWPASGNFPNDVFSTATPWSIALNPDKFNVSESALNSIKVQVTRAVDGKTWTLSSANDVTYPTGSTMTGPYFHVNTDGYGINNCIIFQIGSSKLGATAYSGKYTVSVTGLRLINGNAASLKYTVNFFSMGEDISKISDPSYERITGTTIYEGVDYSKVYDYTYYLTKYPDLLNAFNGNPEAAIRHFVNYGMKEGRQAKGNFEVNSYKNKYQDLRLAFGNDLRKYYEHYIKYGYREGRIATGVAHVENPVTRLNGVDYSKVYDYYYYTNKYADIKKAFGNDDISTLRHFINYGMREGRQAKASFELKSYRLGYRDLRAAFGNNNSAYYMHYIKYGFNEKRKATGITELCNGVTVYQGVDYSRVYDFSYYVKHNPDVWKAFGNDENAVIRHFVLYGMREGRQAKADFNLKVYKSRYADLRRAYGNDNRSYYIHYINWGYKEKRKAY